MRQVWLRSTLFKLAMVCAVAWPSLALAQTSYAGEEISVLLLQQDTFTYLEQMSHVFEAETGISVTFDVLPESTLIPRLQVSLSSRTGEYDVVTANTRLFGPMVSGGWIQPIDELLNNQTEAEWDFADIIPRLVENLSANGETYGLPYATETNILYYNKDMFEAAGLDGPPTNRDELMEYAALLHKPEDGQYGIAMRATREGGQNGFAWIMIWMLFGGDWYAEADAPFAVLDRPEAVAATEYYSDLLTNYGPPGITSYGWQEALLAFTEGRIAMLMDASPFSPQVEDPQQSAVAGRVGYGVVEGEGDAFTVGPIWGFFLADTVTDSRRGAAWEWMKWATSRETMLMGVGDEVYSNPTRSSVLQSEAFVTQFNSEWAATLDRALNFSNPLYTPLVPEGSEIRSFLAVALSEVLAGQKSAEEAMRAANEQIKALAD